MPAPPSEPTFWSFVASIAKLSFLVALAVAVYAIRFRQLIWFTIRAFNREPSGQIRERGRGMHFTRATSLIAALWYLKDLFVPKGLGHWLFGDVAPGIPADHEPLRSQAGPARCAAKHLLGGVKRIVIFTGGAGWGKTHTSHNLKTRLAPLAQIDVSWTMISANPESRIVEEFMKVAKTAGDIRSVSLSFDHLEMLFRGNRAKTSPHFFVHIHDFEAIAVESQSLASARRLIQRVERARHVSLVITTRHSRKRLEQLLPILLSDLVKVIPIKKLFRADVRHLLSPRRVPEYAWELSPLKLSLLRQYDELRRRQDRLRGREACDLTTAPVTAVMYLELFRDLTPAQQVCLQLLLARLVVSPERLFLRGTEATLAALTDGDSKLRLFAYVEGGGEHMPVARLAHPTVLALYSDPEIMSPVTRRRRHGQWAELLATDQAGDTAARLQLIRHELRAGRGRARQEDEITSVTYGETLTRCRFLFECRSDFHEYLTGGAADLGESPSAILALHDDTGRDDTDPDTSGHDETDQPDHYKRVVEALKRYSETAEMWPVRTRNLVKMMELLYQGLDAWEAANELGEHLEKLGSGFVYGRTMNAVFEFDYMAHTSTAIQRSYDAHQAWGQGSRNSSFTLATMLINEGIFRNNRFKNDAARNRRQFDLALDLYLRAQKLIVSAMDSETRPAYRLLMLRERLRISSGLLRWRYLKEGPADIEVERFWTETCELIEREAGWPAAGGIQEFAYCALNVSFIELARKGLDSGWHTYYEAARNYQEAAGDRWFRLRLDQMAVLAATRGQISALRRQEGLRALGSVAEEMRGMEDWTGMAFCAYQMVALKEKPVERKAVAAQYEDCAKKDPKRKPFRTRLARERLFAILCGGTAADKKKYFPAWTERPMPLNLHGLLLLRAVSLLDQANWTPDGA